MLNLLKRQHPDWTEAQLTDEMQKHGAEAHG